MQIQFLWPRMAYVYYGLSNNATHICVYYKPTNLSWATRPPAPGQHNRLCVACTNAGKFMWNPLGHEPFGGLVQLQEYAKHLLEAGNGRLLFRCEGRFGRGMQILDSGDCNSLDPLGECDRTYLHKDWDNNRLNVP